MRKLSTAWLALMLCLSLQAVLTPGYASDWRTQRAASVGKTDPLAPVAAGRTVIAAADRAAVLGTGWHTSDDIAWTLQGDGSGLNVLAADERAGYAWRTVTTLAEPGFETSAWIGNACASQDVLVVAYAPREFTNHADLSERGAFVATVDLRTGQVNKLPVTASTAYFSPACGTGGSAVVTQEGGEVLRATRLVQIDVATGRIQRRITVKGQLTSAVPTAQGIVAADSGALVRVDPAGRLHRLVRTEGVPFDVTAAADGSVVFLEHVGTEARVRRVPVETLRRPAPRTVAPLVATGPLTATSLVRSGYGSVFVTSAFATAGLRSRGVTPVAASAGSFASTRGRLFTRARELRPGSFSAAGANPAAALRVDGFVTQTRRNVAFDAVPTTPDVLGAGTREGPVLLQRTSTVPESDPTGRAAFATAGSPTVPAEAERTCSVARNDPKNQAMQPKPRQVEWAADQAVKGLLTVSRPKNWKNLGMPAYTPQGLFPMRALAGGGQVPAQILLGVMMQESNLWEASRHALPGVTGNPLIGNYYGLPLNASSDAWAVNFSQADCGYGVTQFTDGMRLAGKTLPGEVALPYQTQRAVALDFAANVAAGLRLLQDKWNQTYDAGMRINNADPSRIENWFFAVWAYNSGMHALTDASKNDGAWGVGWLNNPANPRYPANRTAFLDNNNASDAAHPQDWPYPEKVIGFAAAPVQLLESPGVYVPAYRAASWNPSTDANGVNHSGEENRTNAKPPINQFCDATVSCFPGSKYTPNAPDVSGEPAGPCAHENAALQYDLKCWYHGPSTWKPDCAATCGYEFIRFSPGYAYQDDATTYAPLCSSAGLPTGAKIIDDVPNGTLSVRPNCNRFWTQAGTFTLNFKPAADGTYPGKIDFHQIGGGFGGHFWFAHTRTSGPLDVSATWKMSTTRTGPMEVLVALPEQGAETSFATYTIATATGPVTRVVKQAGGSTTRWASLGAFSFKGYPQVSLTSVTANGTGDQDIAFDAVAFVPMTGTFKSQSVEAVSEFDEDQNLDTSDTTSWMGGPLAGRSSLHDWGLSTSGAILAAPGCGQVASHCVGPATANAALVWKAQVDAAGTDPVNHPPGTSLGTWIGFAQKYTDRPTSTTRPSWFSDDNRFKIREKISATYLVDRSNKIIPGSEWLDFEERTGNTHLPEFLTSMIKAIQTDYGIAPPDMTYTTTDLNSHDGVSRTSNPLVTGVLPGRAYAYAADYPWLGTVANQGGTCLAAAYTSGGSIGYRAFIGAQDGVPTGRFASWVDTLRNSTQVPYEVVQMMDDVNGMLFANGVPGFSGSAFNVAPPIWLNLSVGFCPDGTIQQVNGLPILRVSYMPDVYLYHNDKAMTLTGAVAAAGDPVFKGDFRDFSAAPLPSVSSAFGSCDANTGRAGNPWDMTPVPFSGGDNAGYDPATAHSCLDASAPMDPTRSSP